MFLHFHSMHRTERNQLLPVNIDPSFLHKFLLITVEDFLHILARISLLDFIDRLLFIRQRAGFCRRFPDNLVGLALDVWALQRRAADFLLSCPSSFHRSRSASAISLSACAQRVCSNLCQKKPPASLWDARRRGLDFGNISDLVLRHEALDFHALLTGLVFVLVFA